MGRRSKRLRYLRKQFRRGRLVVGGRRIRRGRELTRLLLSR